MVNEAVSDTGPIIHLTEINLLKAFNIFSKLTIPYEVEKELQRYKVAVPSNVKIKKLTDGSKDKVKILTNQYDLNLGEAAAISLTLQKKADYFLTDDLDARQVAKEYNLKVHGSIGIIMRAFRNKIISKDQAIEKIKELKVKSSLFITQDLINEAIEAINKFSK